MKECSYCGRDNANEALNCRECGAEFELPKSATDGLHDAVKTVTIRLFVNHEAAAIAAANLEAHGIKCWMSSDDCGGMYPNMTAATGVRLRVSAEDATEATALLDTPLTAAEMVSQEEPATDSKSSPPNPPKGKLALGQIFIGIILGVILTWAYHALEKEGKHTYFHRAKNGKPDEKWIYQDGNLMEHLMDNNGDGEWDYWSYHDGHGKIVRTEEDNNFDGKPDMIWIYSNGELASSQEDTDYNGIPDAFCTYSNHVIQQLDMKPNGAKYSTLREIFKNGVVTEIWRGGDSNGNFEEVVRYDPFFNPISTNGFVFQKIATP